MSGRARTLRWAIGIWTLSAFAVWNGFFDIMVTRGEKFYLLAQARHELGLAPRFTLHDIMSQTVRDAAWVATLWALAVLATGAVTTWLCLRIPRQQ